MDSSKEKRRSDNGTFYTGRRTEFEIELTDQRDVMAFRIGAIGLKKDFVRTIPNKENENYEKYLMSEIIWISFKEDGGSILAKGTAEPIFLGTTKEGD